MAGQRTPRPTRVDNGIPIRLRVPSIDLAAAARQGGQLSRQLLSIRAGLPPVLPVDYVLAAAQAALGRRGARLPSPWPGQYPQTGGNAGRAPSQPSLAKTARDQGLAAARGAQDAFTFGLGDRAYAGVRALKDATEGEDLANAYRARMDIERARDAYDKKNYPIARTTGEIAGTGLGIVALGPLDAALAGGVRMAQATPMIAREAAVLAGLGAGGGVAHQASTDLMRGESGSVGDYAGAAVGGAAATLAATRGAAGGAAAVGGGTTSVAQDLFNGRPVSWMDAGRGAQAGGYAAVAPGLAVRRGVGALNARQKGKLGEALGRARTRLRFEGVGDRYARVDVSGGPRFTRPDHITSANVLTEQKFGASARLSKNQTAAYNEFGDRYRVDHFLPRDVGVLAAYPFGVIGYGLWNEDR